MYDDWLPAFDWSDYQPPVDAAAAKADGYVLGIRKACQGTRVGGQARYVSDRDACVRAGLPFGPYGFTEAAHTRDGDAEARALLASTGDLAGCTVAPTLDMEDLPGEQGLIERTLGPNGVAEFSIAWGRRIKAETGWQGIVYVGLPIPMAPLPELLEMVTFTPNYGSTADYATTHVSPGYRPTWKISPDQPWTGAQQALIQHSGGNGRSPRAFPGGTAVDCDLVNPALLSHICTQGADDSMSADDVAAINAHTDQAIALLNLANQVRHDELVRAVLDGRDYFPITLAGDGDYTLVRQLWARTAEYPALDGSVDGLVFPYCLTKIPDGPWYNGLLTIGAFSPTRTTIDPAAATDDAGRAELEAQLARMRSLPVVPFPNLPLPLPA